MKPPGPSPLTPSLQAAILRFDTCKVANAIEVLGIRLKNEGFTRPGLMPVSGPAKRALGFAVTAKVKCTEPPIKGSRSYYDLGDWWRIIQDWPQPRVAVIQDIDARPGMGAVLSDVHAHVLTALHCQAVVTNGAVRDVEALAKMEFAAFAGFIGLSHAYVHMVDYACPVEILGLPVAPSELVYVDAHGMIKLPPLALLPELVRVLEQRERQEAHLIDLCQQGQPLEEICKALGEL